jgi:hypothetical protein
VIDPSMIGSLRMRLWRVSANPQLWGALRPRCVDA